MDHPEPKGRKAVVMLTLRKLKEMVESPKKGEKKHKSPLAEEMNEFVSFCTRFALSFDKISYISAKFK